MNLGFSEMLFLFLLALIIFGPKKLPEIGRQVGKALAEFRRASNEFKAQLEVEMRQIEIEESLKKEQEKEKEEATHTILPPAGTVAAGTVTTDSGGTSVSPLPSAETEARIEPSSNSEAENKLPAAKESEITPEAVKSTNG